MQVKKKEMLKQTTFACPGEHDWKKYNFNLLVKKEEWNISGRQPHGFILENRSTHAIFLAIEKSISV